MTQNKAEYSLDSIAVLATSKVIFSDAFWWKPFITDFILHHESLVSTIEKLLLTSLKLLNTLVKNMLKQINTFNKCHSQLLDFYLNYYKLSMHTAYTSLSFPFTFYDLIIQMVNV